MTTMFGAELTPEERIVKAKIDLEGKKPFFSIPLLKMNLTYMPDLKKLGGLCAVDANLNLYWCDELAALPMPKIKTVLMHEVLHVMLEHLARKSFRHKEIFNYSTDLVVNDILKSEGCDFPDKGLIPDNNHTFTDTENNLIVKDLDKKSAEDVYAEIYPKLIKQMPPPVTIRISIGMPGDGDGQKQDGDGKGDGKDGEGKGGMQLDKRQGKGWDVHIDFDPSTPEGQKKIEEMKDLLTQSVVYARMKGDLPASLERIAGKILDSKVNWKVRLYRYLVNYLPADYSWRTPSKRLIDLGIYMPSVYRENIEIVGYIDSSGSISDDDLSDFKSEIIHLSKSFSNLLIHIIVCDAEVHQYFTLTNGNVNKLIDMKIKGGGGTSTKPVLDYIEKNIPNCKVMVGLTDGYSDINSLTPPPYDVLWVIAKNGVPQGELKWGDTIKID